MVSLHSPLLQMSTLLLTINQCDNYSRGIQHHYKHIILTCMVNRDSQFKNHHVQIIQYMIRLAMIFAQDTLHQCMYELVHTRIIYACVLRKYVAM